MDIRDTLLLIKYDNDGRGKLRALFEKKYNVLEASNGQQALMLLKQNCRCVAAVLLDADLPEKESWKVMRKINRDEELSGIPVVMVISDPTEDSELQALERGAADVVVGRYDNHVLFHRVKKVITLTQSRNDLEKKVEEQTDILRHSNEVMVDALSTLIEYRSVESGLHILRIRRFTQILMAEIARSCPEYQLDEKTVDIVASASALHDIGKIAIPDSILNKPGRLSHEEWNVMKTHALTGSKILEELDGMGNEEYLRYAHNICHYHHERWDGNGYPEGISGDNIPICAQVVGLADAYDALTNKRVYKEAFSHEQAVNMILKGECGVFSPKLLECLKNVNKSFSETSKKYADGKSPKNDTITIPLPGPALNETMDTLQATQAKYQMLLHYIDAVVLELDIDEGVYHLVYNPYPELGDVITRNSFEEGIRDLIRRYIPVKDQGSALWEFFRKIRTFLEEGARKQEYEYCMYSPSQKTLCNYEVVFLRLHGERQDRRRLILLWRRLGKESSEKTWKKESRAGETEGEGSFSYRLDRWLTMEEDTGNLTRLLGYTRDEVTQLFQNQMIQLLSPEEKDTAMQRLREQLQRGKLVEVEYRMIHKKGHDVWILNQAHLVTGEDGREYLSGKIIDVTKAHHRQGILQKELERDKLILSQVDHVTFDWNILDDRLERPERWMELFGYEPISLSFSKNLSSSHLHPEDVDAFIDCLEALKQGEKCRELKIRLAKADGRYLWCRFRAVTQYDPNGTPVRVVGVLLNIDEFERAAERLLEKAERDGLTGLLNKKTGREQVERLLAQRGAMEKHAMMIIDLDNFKQVNDRYGHMFGDAVLAQAAQEIQRQFRMDDIIARIGGDEFMVFMKNVPDEERVRCRCEKLVDSFRTLFEERIPGSGMTCSIGIAMCPTHGVAHQELFHGADQALYQAKKLGKNRYAFYDMDQTVSQRETTVNQHIDSDDEMKARDTSLIHYTFHRLYQSGDVEGTIQAVMEIIGKQLNVSRVYIFENDLENRFCSNTFEWCNVGIQPEIENLQSVSYETDIPGYEWNFDERGIFYCPDIRNLPQEQYEILEPQGIKSMLQCAIRDNGVFRGYVGFDECVQNRLWTKEQIDMLTFLSEVLSIFLLKYRAQMEMEQKAEDLNSILDNQNAWIYVVDPTTLELLFINEKTKRVIPDIKIGRKCYSELRGYDQRCHDCPLEGIETSKNKEMLIYNERLQVKVLAEATYINWQGKESGLLTCWEVKEE